METSEFNPEALFQEAMIAHQSQQFEKAESLLRKILAKMPENDGVLSTLGGMLLSTGKVPEGIQALEKAIEINPNNPEANLNTGIAYQSLGRREEGFELIEKAAQLAPHRPDIQFNFANILLQLQKYERGIEVLKKLISDAPQFIQAYHSLASVYAYLSKKSEVIQTYESALKLFPSDLNTQILYGNYLMEHGEVDKAIEVFLDSIEKNPTHFLPMMAVGKAYISAGKEQEGLSYLEKAYSLNPKDFNTNKLLGEINESLGRTADAEKYFKNALAIKPDDPDALFSVKKIMSAKIPFWHFEMLADTERNDAYQKAIEKVVTKESIILDIGTGSGLLSMMAARAGATQITACEMHEELAKTAKEIVKLNGFEKEINVLNKKSNFLRVGEDLPSKVNLIISEILDVGGLGEGVIPSIRHACHQLATEDVKLIPSRINLFGQLIEIPSRSMVAPIRKISGFDLSPFETFRVPDTYLRVNLSGEKYRPLSPVIPLLDIDFYNLPPIYPSDQAHKIPFELSINENGMAQAFVFWFDLYLDEEIVVSSKVNGELEHWGQALFCFPNPKEVTKGEKLKITMLQSENVIRFRL